MFLGSKGSHHSHQKNGLQSSESDESCESPLRALEAARSCDLILCVGSTLSVYPVGPVGKKQGNERGKGGLENTPTSHGSIEVMKRQPGIGSLIRISAQFYGGCIKNYVQDRQMLHSGLNFCLSRWHPSYQKPKSVVQNLCLGPKGAAVLGEEADRMKTLTKITA